MRILATTKKPEPPPSTAGHVSQSKKKTGPTRAGVVKQMCLSCHDIDSSIRQTVQAKMEGALNTGFSDVKVHANSNKAAEVGALAYTQGTDIHFAPGQYSPTTSTGKKLLGHELAHVVQQSEGRVQATGEVGGLPLNDNPALEHEADIIGAKAVS